MGYYINPRTESKEDFLFREGTRISLTEFKCFADFSGPNLPVCLVNNGPFTAAGIGVDAREIEAFAYPDGRPKVFFLVPKTKLVEVGAIRKDEDFSAVM